FVHRKQVERERAYMIEVSGDQFKRLFFLFSSGVELFYYLFIFIVQRIYERIRFLVTILVELLSNLYQLVGSTRHRREYHNLRRPIMDEIRHRFHSFSRPHRGAAEL